MEEMHSLTEHTCVLCPPTCSASLLFLHCLSYVWHHSLLSVITSFLDSPGKLNDSSLYTYIQESSLYSGTFPLCYLPQVERQNATYVTGTSLYCGCCGTLLPSRGVWVTVGIDLFTRTCLFSTFSPTSKRK